MQLIFYKYDFNQEYLSDQLKLKAGLYCNEGSHHDSDF